MSEIEINFKITNGVGSLSMREATEIFDAQQNSLGFSKNHRSALGRGDFATDQEFIDAVDAKVAGALSDDLVNGLANIKAAADNTAALAVTVAERDAEIVQLNADINGRDSTISTLQNEVAARDATIADLQTQLANARANANVSPQPGPP